MQVGLLTRRMDARQVGSNLPHAEACRKSGTGLNIGPMKSTRVFVSPVLEISCIYSCQDLRPSGC